jgi:hypothetical protein
MRRLFGAVMMVGMLVLFCSVSAEEGMWTFDNPPTKLLQEKYGFTPTQEWLDHIRLSCVRFMDGGSGSFISSNGLVLTNHHVAMSQLQKMSSAETNYVQTGFFAAKTGDEIPCTDLEINVLVSMENVSKRILGSVKPEMKEESALLAKKAEIALVEKESLDKTGLKSEVVEFYQGGEYWLYCYRKYTDVRLVMAPERQIAYYGGDDDNFTYPRFDLDMAFFRVYENGKPLATPDYLKWNAKGAGDGELVFVAGHPGKTNRQYTMDQLKYQRDVQIPMMLRYYDIRLDILREYAKQGPEQERRALNTIFGIENSKKSFGGEYEGLLNSELMEKKIADEAAFRKAVNANREWKKESGDAWETISDAVQKQKSRARRNFYRRITGSRLSNIASDIIYYAEEIKKPDSERLEGFHDSELDEFRFYLFSRAPVYRDMETANAVGGMKFSIEEIGPDDPYIAAALGGKTPEEILAPAIEKTRLNDVQFRKRLVEGGKAAVDTCTDPMIVLMRRLVPISRADKEWYRKNIESVITKANEKLARARFDVYGKNVPPDATFTLRLSPGAVKGYPMNGTRAPYKTTLYGLFDRALSFDEKGDFKLPSRFWERKNALDLSTPVNFVCAADIIGGNSGSPVINRNADLVGLVFDGNIESLPGRFVYDETRNRTVSVHSAYIIEALRKLYDAGALADEIEGR